MEEKKKKKKEIVKLIFLHRSLTTGQRALQNALGWLKQFMLSVIWKKKILIVLTSTCFIHYHGG